MTTTVPRTTRGTGRRRTLAELLDSWKDTDGRMIFAGRLINMSKVAEAYPFGHRDYPKR